MSKKNLAIIVGGKSPEHEISLISGYNIYKAADKHIFECIIVGIAKDGQWYLIPTDTFESNIIIGSKKEHEPIVLAPFSDQPFLYQNKPQEKLKIDVIFPIAHGVNGEDGSLQGILKHLNKPFVGPDYLGSAMGMDKDITKKLAQHAGVPVVPSYTARFEEDIPYSEIIKELGLPLFIKPVNMGSAVGVEKIESAEQLKEGLIRAFKLDPKVLIEKAIIGRELETAVLGNSILKITGMGEIVVENGFYTYENKYENDKASVVIPAQNLSEKSVSIMQEMALTTYKALELKGMSRVDFFYVSDEEVYLNEVNTLPGFTNISMFPKLFEYTGLTFTNLVTELVRLAEER